MSTIGTLNEGPLHEALKTLYTPVGARAEVAVGGHVADVAALEERGGAIVEVQTSNLGGLRRRLDAWLDDYAVLVVHPIPGIKHIIKLDEGVEGARRRSPKRGRIADVVDELVRIPGYLEHPHLTLEVVLTEEEEVRLPDARRTRKGWRVVQRRLVRVLESFRICDPSDLFALIPGELPTEFTTHDIAQAMDRPRWIAQKLAYCLRETGRVEIVDKKGNALVYRRVPHLIPFGPGTEAAKGAFAGPA